MLPYKIILKKGTKCRFFLLNVSHFEGESSNYIKQLKLHDGVVCKIISIAISPQVSGDYNTGYYDIRFSDGKVMKGISGYHLRKVE